MRQHLHSPNLDVALRMEDQCDRSDRGARVRDKEMPKKAVASSVARAIRDLDAHWQ